MFVVVTAYRGDEIRIRYVTIHPAGVKSHLQNPRGDINFRARTATFVKQHDGK
jgi:hypothetical protein